MKRIVRYVILCLFIVVIGVVRTHTGMGEWYALRVYPYVMGTLSFFSGFFPFSVNDLIIFFSLLWLVIYPFYGWYKRMPWKKILLRMAEYLAWMYVGFYMLWGLNYFRKDFYTRTGINKIIYTPEDFDRFLANYAGELNRRLSYMQPYRINKERAHDEITYAMLNFHSSFGLAKPCLGQQPKPMLFSSLFSKLGIRGYMGPFFAEFQLNKELPSLQYAATYAHEKAHLMGITGEAEANFYAYLACRNAFDPQLQFLGYFSLLPYVLQSARHLLSEEKFEIFINGLHPQIMNYYQENRLYWQQKYSPYWGNVQRNLFDWFLRKNRMANGIQDYSEVVRMVISYEEAAAGC